MSLTAPVDLEGHFRSFVQASIGTTATPDLAMARKLDLSSFDAGSEERLAAATQAILSHAENGGTHHREGTLSALGVAMDASDRAFADAGFDAFARSSFRIRKLEPEDWSRAGDFFYVKINHAFWEQLYTLFASDPEPSRMRITDAPRFRRLYLDTGFILPLATALRESATVSKDGTHILAPSFAISFYAGMLDHQAILSSHPTADAATRRIHAGACVGANGFLRALFDKGPFHVGDGCFPKMALENGQLKQCLDKLGAGCRRIVFVVPQHLEGIRYAFGDEVPQDVLLIPRGNVYRTWAASLFLAVRHILARLAQDERVIVMTQSGVFSALLGLYLRRARNDLMPGTGRLHFLDLGQVLDIAAPESGGPWIRRFRVDERSLFRIDG